MDSVVKQIRFSSNNDSLLDQAFSELVGLYLTSSKKDASDRDFKPLWDLCQDESFAVSTAAAKAVTFLLKQNAITVDTTLSVALSLVPTVRHLGPLVKVIGEVNIIHLLARRDDACPFKIDYPQHPLITIFSMRNESWPWILEVVKCLTSHDISRARERSLKALGPLILHIICNGENDAHVVAFRHQLWAHLLWTLQRNVNNSRELILHSLSLMQDSRNSQFYQHSLQTLAESLMDKATQFADLAPIVSLSLASTITSLLAEGKDIHHTLLLVDGLTDSFDFPIEPLVVLLSKSLLEMPASGTEQILSLCLKWKGRVGHESIWRVLQGTALQIAGFQTRAPCHVQSILRFNCRTRMSGAASYPNEKYLNPECRSAIIVTKLLTSPSGDAALLLQRMNADSSVTAYYPALFLLAASIFLETTDLEIIKQSLKILTGAVVTEKKRSLYVLALLLRKLSTNIAASLKTEILYNLPLLASDKLCIPKLLRIINALDSVPDLRPLRIRLLTDLWLVEDRTYSYLEKALQIKEKDFELSLAKAFAISTICATRPEKYGSEWLTAISHQLSGALGGSDENSCTLGVISLRTLTALCEAEVVDLRSVWVMLASKLSKDHRTPVRREMCKLLGLTPKLRVESAEFELFVSDVLRMLFGICLDDSESEDVNLEAYRALSKFQRADFTLDVIPDICKANLKANAADKAAAAADLLLPQLDNLVPGECWGQLLNVDPCGCGVELLLGALVKQEVKDMPNWVYRKTASEHIRKMEPPNYNYLKEDSVLRGLVRLLSQQNSAKGKIQTVFRILDQNFEKVLPPLDWFTLWPVAQSSDCEEEFARIICRLCPTSFSACRILEAFLQNTELKESLNFVLLENLAHLSTALGTSSAQTFLKETARKLQAKSEFFHSLSRSLDYLTLPEEVASQISDLLKGTPTTNGDAAFADCVFKLPIQMRESLLKEGSVGFLKNFLSSAVASSSGEIPDSLVHRARALSSDEGLLISYSLILTRQRSKPAITSWLQKFIAGLRCILTKYETVLQVLTDLSNIFVVTVNALSDITLLGNTKDTILQDSWNNLDMAISILLRNAKWNAAHQEIVDWLLMTAELATSWFSQREKVVGSLKIPKSENKLQGLSQWSRVASVIETSF